MPHLELPGGQVHEVGQPVPDEALADAHEALEEGTAEVEVPGPLPCITAFIVYQLPDGRWQVSDDLDAPLVPERKCHADDLTAGCSTTMRDVQTQEVIAVMAGAIGPSIVQNTVNNVLNNIPQALANFGQQIRSSAESAKIAEQLERDKARGRRN